MKHFITFMFLVALAVAVIAFGSCDKINDDPADTSSTAEVTTSGDETTTLPEETTSTTEETTTGITEKNFSAVYPENDESVILINDTVWNFSNGYVMGEKNKLATFSGLDEYYPKTLTLSFGCEKEADYYRVSISRKADMTDAEVFLTGERSVVLDHLFNGVKYYWQVDAVTSEKTYRSSVYSFSTVSGPRAIFVDGVSNTRDIGGMAGLDGKRIKQGMIYRGGHILDITPEGRHFFVDILGLKTELDLRTPGEGGAGSGSPLGKDVKYINIDGRYYTSADGPGIDGANNRPYILKELKVFADPANYPIYIHCSLGRDRTGTLAFLIQGLCGADKQSMALDYELSSLSYVGSLGADRDDYFTSLFNMLYDFIDNKFAGNTFAEKVEKYMLKIGMKQEEIDTIRNLMLEEV